MLPTCLTPSGNVLGRRQPWATGSGVTAGSDLGEVQSGGSRGWTAVYPNTGKAQAGRPVPARPQQEMPGRGVGKGPS